MVITMFIAVLILLQTWITRGRDYVTVSGAAQEIERSSLGRWAWFVNLSIVLFVVVGIVAPVAQVIMGSFQAFFGVYGSWTTDHYQDVLADSEMTRTLVNTLLISVLGGFATVVCAFVIAYAMQRRRGRISLFLRVGSWVPLAAPGIVLSVALLWTYLHTPGIKSLYGTPWLLVAALMVATIPVAVRALEGVIAQVGPELEEAARMSSAGPIAACVNITARLCLPALLGGWLMVAMFMAGVLDVPLLLASADTQTVATLTYTLATNNGEYSEAAAIYCLFFAMVAALIAAVGVVYIVTKGLLALQRRGIADLTS
jgi:iron(III) transport system permease protein